MNFADKIQFLRKSRNLTQEQLAELCEVTRQSVAKWETGDCFPEISKLLVLSSYFGVPTDNLLKDELDIDSTVRVSSCGKKNNVDLTDCLFQGVLIKESIDDDSVIDRIIVHKTEIWNVGGSPKYWTALHFTSKDTALPDYLSKVMISDPEKGGNWFADFKHGEIKFIVFRNKILKYRIGNFFEKNEVIAECRKMGISDGEMNWSE